MILIFLLNAGDSYALLVHGNSNGSDTTHGSSGHNADEAEIKQMVLNLTTEMEYLRRQTNVLGEEKRLLQNKVFSLEAELNKLNASKPPSNEVLMAYLRSTKQIVQTLAANEEYDKNLTQQLNEAKNDIAICEKQNKNLTKRLDEVVNNLVINEKQAKNLTQRLNEVENILVKYDNQGKNVTQRLNEIYDVLTANNESDKNLTLRLNEAEDNIVICDKQNKNLTRRLNEVHNVLIANEEYDKNLTLQLTDSMNNLHDIKVQMRYTSLSLMDVHSKTDKLNTTLTTQFDDQIRDVYRRITNITKKVAFTAGVSSGSGSWSSGTLVFDRIVYNIGGGYDSSTGVFTSPVDGHFVFFVNVQAYGSNTIYTYLVLNGSTKVTTLAYGYSGYMYNSAGPNLAVLRLQKRDRVWVKHYSGTGYNTDSTAPFTTFSGFLI
ncbi:uncharacterized protein LOC134250583 [Saccostrea cucullata]|uniref:uncharacterized protein LOC134250583 n=1 Tax=Saccostrea cuccullata TaxID=36930 RepID=UPI002ED2399A